MKEKFLLVENRDQAALEFRQAKRILLDMIYYKTLEYRNSSRPGKLLKVTFWFTVSGVRKTILSLFGNQI